MESAHSRANTQNKGPSIRAWGSQRSPLSTDLRTVSGREKYPRNCFLFIRFAGSSGALKAPHAAPSNSLQITCQNSFRSSAAQREDEAVSLSEAKAAFAKAYHEDEDSKSPYCPVKQKNTKTPKILAESFVSASLSIDGSISERCRGVPRLACVDVGEATRRDATEWALYPGQRLYRHGAGLKSEVSSHCPR